MHVAAFYEDYLIEDENGALKIVPSQSPENRFTDSGPDFPVSLCVSASMDVELASDLLSHAVQASEILGVDEDLREVWRSMVGRLPELRIGSKGQLLEWNEELDFLPALPSAWPTGTVRGLRARGGFTVDLSWSDGALEQATVVAKEDRPCIVRLRDRGRRFSVTDEAGSPVSLTTSEKTTSFHAKAGVRYTLRPTA